ncbi:hypothetical protein BpHYR1_024030 [Brachionus plicatilis]|uniref:Uncharacterized protein n=1 Tax=Brachionus plicatilis TaxID=10195 RepID=A0A3M7SII3_BRAPC|nr:hypothetical protein BpHYR1_024030 [Brachionus plicatilis]
MHSEELPKTQQKFFYEPEINYVKRGRKTTTFYKSICGLLFPENAEVAKSELDKLVMDRLLWKKNVAECCKSLFD